MVIRTGSGKAFMESISPEGFDFFSPQGYDKIYREGKVVAMPHRSPTAKSLNSGWASTLLAIPAYPAGLTPMQAFQLTDLLQALGPTASMIFAAWLFLTFLQQRYTNSYARYRALIAEYRTHREQDKRRQSLRGQIFEYKWRCEQMRRATSIGVFAAILLISALVFAALNTLDDRIAALKYLTGVCAIVGLLLVICAAGLVISENSRLQLIIDSELSDLSDLAERARDTNGIRARRR